jgi:hypothetical protein
MFHSKLEFNKQIEEISELTGISTINSYPMKEKYRIIWRYLHNYRVKVAGSTVSPQQLKAPRKEQLTEQKKNEDDSVGTLMG